MNDLNLRREKKTNTKRTPIYLREKEDYPLITDLQCQEHQITATLSDGRTISIPTAWFKRLRKANIKQLNKYEILPDGYGITWPDLDEDISVKAFVEGMN
ncbi:DUF2442 domain-containing protein [endosymbiont GvMRE of Glomus versiforme]|uniref:DUF2442 domain-containing protein n=1 Tax=endosymbiont GvMRE of Glomus versiforme TaxID=2039283 RepID=UPI000EEDFB0F|nr:DUF2442 domain-containing protein [endosymbiont GvMRE of Glomus versiforme]RHZ37742.1 Protein of uncharacterized function (DUF3532) [endosymbiont GvMRE of Glomus versiforme]